MPNVISEQDVVIDPTYFRRQSRTLQKNASIGNDSEYFVNRLFPAVTTPVLYVDDPLYTPITPCKGPTTFEPSVEENLLHGLERRSR